MNACIDIDTQMPFYPEFAFNNTYGIKAINETQYQSALAASGQCRALSATCRAMADEKDPLGHGNVPDVNDACLEAYLFCFRTMHSGFDKQVSVILLSRASRSDMFSKRNLFDIAAPVIESFPHKWPAGYLNRAEIQQALGVPLNFTGNSMVIASSSLLIMLQYEVIVLTTSSFQSHRRLRPWSQSDEPWFSSGQRCQDSHGVWRSRLPVQLARW
jgi:hypothetical protein